MSESDDPADLEEDDAGEDTADDDAFALHVALTHAERTPSSGPAGDGVPDAEHDETSDHEARRVLAALEHTRDDLARHGDALVGDAPAMPPAVLARLDRALAAERAADAVAAPRGPGPDEGVPVSPARRRPRATVGGRARSGVAALVLAAVLVVVVAAALGASATRDGPPARAAGDPTRVVTPPAGAVPVLAGADVADVAVALRTGLGRADYGPLADPDRRAGCLAAQADPPVTAPVGAREVVLDGRSAVLFVFTTGVAARFRVLVVDAACGPGRPLTLADRVVGR